MSKYLEIEEIVKYVSSFLTVETWSYSKKYNAIRFELIKKGCQSSELYIYNTDRTTYNQLDSVISGMKQY